MEIDSHQTPTSPLRRLAEQSALEDFESAKLRATSMKAQGQWDGWVPFGGNYEALVGYYEEKIQRMAGALGCQFWH